MIGEKFSWLLLAGALAIIPSVQATARPLAATAASEPDLIAAQAWPGWQGGPAWGQDQGRREHCWRLRNRAREIGDRINYAPPWERGRMERHLWEVRERLRGECWGGGRDWE